MQWIIPCDLNYYDARGAFEKLKTIDWRQHNRFNIDDIIYIYASAPHQSIMFKTKVVDIDLSYEETIDDREFWKRSEGEEDAKKKRRYVRLQLINISDSESLNLNHLMKYGLKKAPQGAVRCIGDKLQLGEYISECFEGDSSIVIDTSDQEIEDELRDGYEVLEDDEVYYEGSVTTVKVNKYERNQEARRKCIEIHGCQCKICGFDFEKTYGEAGKGLVHVHHVVPISSIKEEYQVDYEKDLIPVCPNCHAMIHRKKDPYAIEEIKVFINSNK